MDPKGIVHEKIEEHGRPSGIKYAGPARGEPGEQDRDPIFLEVLKDLRKLTFLGHRKSRIRKKSGILMEDMETHEQIVRRQEKGKKSPGVPKRETNEIHPPAERDQRGLHVFNGTKGPLEFTGESRPVALE
jgi:hypothetical protein